MPIIQTPSIASVVEDQTPQLGGSLSTSGSNINVESGDVLYVHNLGTEGDANYERLEFKWDANVAKIQTATAGTGSNDTLELIGSNSLLFIGPTLASFVNASLTMTQSDTLTETYNDFVPATDSTYENGSSTLRWSNTFTDTITIGNGVDAVLTADADNELALRNGNNGCVQNIYKDYTDASNYERLKVGWDGSIYLIGPEAAGTGSVNHAVRMGTASNYLQSFGGGNMDFYRGGTLVLRFNTANQFDWRGNDLFSTNAGKKLGTAAKRWGGVYTDGFATNVETFTAASDTLDERNNVCLCDCTSNAIRLALPVPVSGLQFHIKKTDATANTVAIEPDDPGPELIDGAVEAVISSQYDSITVVSDGSNWFVI